MKKWTALGAAVAAIGIVGVLWLQSGPDVSQFADLASPRLARLENQRMLVVDAVGDPNAVAGGAFKDLFAAYYAMPGMSRWQKPPAPRARWARPLDTAPAAWVGRYALPLPPEAAEAAPIRTGPGARVHVAVWEYGDVAEVLHVGPYSSEEADIIRLQNFVIASGRRIIGDHEEEYVRGPGMFFAGDPRRYLTIIRLRVSEGPEETLVE
jgi:hypothetical protein